MLVPQAIHATIPQFGPVFRTFLPFCQQRFAPVFMCCLGRANSALSLCWRRQLCYFPCLACYGSPCHARAPAPTRTGWLQADRVKTAPTLFGYRKDKTRSLTTCSDWMLLPEGHRLLFWQLTTKKELHTSPSPSGPGLQSALWLLIFHAVFQQAFQARRKLTCFTTGLKNNAGKTMQKLWWKILLIS